MTDRKPARWMCVLDERIIEHLADQCWSNAKVLNSEIELFASEGRIEERLKLLADAGLVAPLYDGAGLYQITAEGQEYLAGQLNANHLPEPSIWAF